MNNQLQIPVRTIFAKPINLPIYDIQDTVPIVDIQDIQHMKVAVHKLLQDTLRKFDGTGKKRIVKFTKKANWKSEGF